MYLFSFINCFFILQEAADQPEWVYGINTGT